MATLPVWKSDAEATSFPVLNTNLTVDVAIIGGGITGITAAYLLSKAGKTVAVLEARKVAEGTTGYSTGNLYAPVGGEGLHTVKSKWDKETLRDVVESRGAAVDFIEQTVQTLGIDCEFRRVPWCLFAGADGNKAYVKTEREMAEQAGLPIDNQVPFPLHIAEGFAIPNQAQFNPLRYTVSLARKIESERCMIFEDTKVIDVEEGDTCKVQTTGGMVHAAQVIMATHTPKGVYLVHTSMEPYREYAIAATLHSGYPEPGIFWDMAGTEHYSMRTYDTAAGKVLLVLGESHKVGMKEDNNECFEKLENFLKQKFSVSGVIYKWAAQQYRPADNIPYIGISTGNTKTYIATGFAADGLTYGTLAARIISDEILGIENKWSKTYKASRLTPVASFTKFVKANVSVGFELIKDYLAKDDAQQFSEVQPKEGKIMEVDNHKCAVHRDEEGKLHVVSAICPHMGCVVHWNQGEQSWDCPCHGSRFEVNGDVIEGPAYHGLKRQG